MTEFSEGTNPTPPTVAPLPTAASGGGGQEYEKIYFHNKLLGGKKASMVTETVNLFEKGKVAVD